MHKFISLVFIALGVVSAPSIAIAHNIVINCHKIQKYSHSQVHFGLSMIGNRVAHSTARGCYHRQRAVMVAGRAKISADRPELP